MQVSNLFIVGLFFFSMDTTHPSNNTVFTGCIPRMNIQTLEQGKLTLLKRIPAFFKNPPRLSVKNMLGSLKLLKMYFQLVLWLYRELRGKNKQIKKKAQHGQCFCENKKDDFITFPTHTSNVT